MTERLVYAGDSLLVVEMGEKIDAQVNARVVRLSERLQQLNVPGVRDVVPTYRSAAVHFDPLRTDVGALVDAINAATRAEETASINTRALHRIPVTYGGISGPDLPEVARFAGLSEEEVVELHSRTKYRVFMLGFVPGFAYMGTVDPRIAAPRRKVPRERVAAGSVGIAGSQTGIYSMETPGGWQLIGSTTLRLFDLERAEPFALKPGDVVEFYPVDPSTTTDQPTKAPR
jgi:KipI family sensor histidine kinase inhibitor